MSKTIIILPILAIIGLCGFFENPMAQDKYVAVGYTGQATTCLNAKCFEEKFAAGEPAQYDLKDENVQIHMEVRGKSKSGNTVVYLRIDDFNESQVPENMRIIAKNAKGSDMVCALDSSDVDKIMAGNVDKTMLDNCDGPLKGWIMLIPEK
ncbi:MAG: hypothetical protein ACP5KJ_02920 [Candidatus Micrarchaeia archaeon]